MKETIIKSIKASKISASLIMPFKISSGQHNILENILLEIELTNGIKGYGEAPIATHITGESLNTTQKNLSNFANKIKGQDISNYFSILLEAQDFFEKNKAGLLAIEMAILDAMTRSLKIPIWKLWNNRVKKIKTDITVVIGEVNEAIKFVKKMRKRGFKIFKIKTGFDMDKDINRILAVYKWGGKPDIYIDANCAYDVKQTIYLINELKKHEIIPAVIEQPLNKDDWEGLKFLTKKLPIPVCADESAYSLNDIYYIISKKTTSAINIKLAKSGIVRATEIYQLAKSKGIKLMIGQMMETQLATFAALHFASTHPFDFIDLDTPYFIKSNVIKYNKKIMSANGSYNISYVKEGIGAVPSHFFLK